jgi:hypothetical protein
MAAEQFVLDGRTVTPFSGDDARQLRQKLPPFGNCYLHETYKRRHAPPRDGDRRSENLDDLAAFVVAVEFKRRVQEHQRAARRSGLGARKVDRRSLEQKDAARSSIGVAHDPKTVAVRPI